VIAPLARLVYRPRVEGKGNVPRTGPVIFASNHLSFIDSIAIPVAAPRPVHFLAKSSYFDGTGVSGWASREFFTSIGAVPVQRGAGQAALDARDQQRLLLEAGLCRPAPPWSRSDSSGPTGSCRSERACPRSASA
jgi:1-acyl-sn-glycerol-3-phosphate acyltransferase